MAAQTQALLRSKNSTVTAACVFWFLAVLRFLAVPPFVIDDDEAWWSAASNGMKAPWDFYRSAVDHKPPGVVWFYWCVNHFIPCASDPRVVRAVYTALTIAAAGILGWTAYRFSQKKNPDRQAEPGIGWLAATLFLLITAVPIPKLLAVTADGLIVQLTILAYAVALFTEFPGVSLVSGAVLGLALLVKQTAVFFAIPILFASFPRKWSWKEIAGFAAGSMLVVIPSIVALGVTDFFYWNWTYPKQVLITVREKLFDSNWEMLESLAIFVGATLPLVVLLSQRALPAIRSGKSALLQGLRDFRILWLVAGILAALIGKGLFLHYLLLFAPPFALLSAEVLASRPKARNRSLAWLGAQALIGAVILMIPSSGIFWGTDLVYFDQLSRVLKKSVLPEEKVMVWGGSALPLAYTGNVHVTRFVLPRFAVAPYATEKTRELFHEELLRDPPELILDLHERGDNQFNNPIDSEPEVARLVRQGYRVYVSENVPWAKFYFRSPPPAGAPLAELRGDGEIQEAYASFPEQSKSWMKLVEIGKKYGLTSATRTEKALRMKASLELLEKQGRNPAVRDRAAELSRQLHPDSLPPVALPADLSWEIQRFIEDENPNGELVPFPLRSMAWWPSVALVELQPRAFKKP